MILCIIFAIILTIDVTIKGSEDSSFLSAIPGCQYIATYSIDQYENPECLTVKGLQKELTDKTNQLEKKIVGNLTELLSLRFQLVCAGELRRVGTEDAPDDTRCGQHATDHDRPGRRRRHCFSFAGLFQRLCRLHNHA